MNFKSHHGRNIVETGPIQSIGNLQDPIFKELPRNNLAFGAFAVSEFSHQS